MTLTLLASDFDGANFRHECNCPLARALTRQYGGVWAEGVWHCARMDVSEPQEYIHEKYGRDEFVADHTAAMNAAYSSTHIIRIIQLN